MKTLDPLKNVPLEIVAIYCCLLFTGCTGSDEGIPDRGIPARLLKTIPPVTTIERFTPLMAIVFDKPVSQVKVNGVDAQPDRSMPVPMFTIWTIDLSHFEQIHPPVTSTIPAARICLTVSYTDESGSHKENLECVDLPELSVEFEPPTIIGGTVIDGEVGVDTEKLNLYGITLQFSDIVTGHLIIHPEGQEESLGWNVEWSEDGAGESVRLHRRIDSKKLLNGTVYIIEFEITDEVGDVLRGKITFTTKA